MKGKKEGGEKKGKEGRKKERGKKKGEKKTTEFHSRARTHDLPLYSQLPMATMHLEVNLTYVLYMYILQVSILMT